MKRLAPVVLVVLSLAGCFLFGSGEAQIVSFSIGGSTATVEIDPELRTAVITAPPFDLSNVAPDIGVSDGATHADLPAFEDGVPATVRVVSESGEEVEWTVTIHLQYGVTFTYEGEWVILLEGVTHSNDMPTNDDYGDGDPSGAVMYYEDILVTALKAEQDAYVDSMQPAEYMELRTPESVTVGSYTSDFYVGYYFDADDDGDYEINYNQFSGSLTVDEIAGAEGGVIRGSFSGSGTDSASASEATIISGYFKVRRIADENYYPWAG